MNAGLRALLSGSIDYAGTFPPARLPLVDAVRNYASYRVQPESWLLSRFVCRTSHLSQFGTLGDKLFAASQPAFRIAAVGRGGQSRSEFLQNLDADFLAIQSFNADAGQRGRVDVMELRLPADVISKRDALADLLAAIDDRLDTTGIADVTLFYESTRSNDWRKMLANVIGTVAAHNQAIRDKEEPRLSDSNRLRLSGFKLRTGTLQASDYPTTQQIAFAITACRDAQLFWKATAGLHNPLGRFDRALGTWTFGFLNIFAATVLAKLHNLQAEQVRSILDADTLDQFVVDDHGFAWGEWRATTESIPAAREATIVSFGSCSFDEPLQGLKQLGLL
jgi:hypothetical protein